MKRFLTFILAFSSLTVQGANWFVTPSGSGSHNGSTWNQAFANTGGINWSSIHAGDTIWLAGGGYGAFWWGASGTSTQPINFKRAVASDANCTGSPGWNGAFDSQVTITTYFSGDGIGGINVAGPGQSGVVIDGSVADGMNFIVPVNLAILNGQTVDEVWIHGSVDPLKSAVGDSHIGNESPELIVVTPANPIAGKRVVRAGE